MTGPLLETKLHVPRWRGQVGRPRLTEQLTRATTSALTLVSAPAGFGKTTVLAEWLAGLRADGGVTGWLSLDPRDNDSAVFWTYLVTALQAAAPGLGDTALSLLQPPRPPIEAILSTLINDLDALPHDVVLVLDDYHLIEARDIQDAMAFLVEHLPPQLHLVIAGRADPSLPLARLRGSGRLTEIRAADLRFTPDEAAAYLNDVMGLALTAENVAALEGRTEGWIAALQLAALSLRGRDDADAFIAGFAGDDRYVVDYLAEEVLDRQPESVQRFLLQTSILDRLTGPLCDAVTGQHDGRATLLALERANLFLVPLDDRRRWYRYHQLFADVLQAHLQDERADQIPELHRRAGRWFSEHGEPAEAIRHALAARDFEHAADLIELAFPAMRIGRQEARVLRWLAELPDEVVRVRPVLGVGFAGAMLSVGEFDGVEARLQAAERLVEAAAAGTDAEPMVVVDQAEFRRVPGMIALFRAAQALAHGDGPGTVRHAQDAIALSVEGDHLNRAAAAGLLGLALWASGDLAAGHAWWTDSMAGLDRAGHVADTFGCAVALADIAVTQGRLGEAWRTYQQALQRSSAYPGPTLRGTADLHTGMSEILRERGDLAGAAEQLQLSQSLGEPLGLPQNPYRWRIAAARIREGDGDLAAALDLLDEAERRYVGDFFPRVRPIPAVRARVWVRQGRSAQALGWAREEGLSDGDELSYLREFEHLTLARVLLAQAASPAEYDRVNRLLGRLLAAAEAGGRTGSVLEVLVLQALSGHAQGRTGAALAALRRALTLAEPEGYQRIFVDEGAPMGALLGAALKQGISPDYVRRLLLATDPRIAPAQPGVIDPLSARELDVLQLLKTDLDGPDIARTLIVSVNTVRTHTKSIYAKLGVNNRRAAVRRAQELDL